MPDLLTAADKAEIKAAIQDVTDTFYKTDIYYLQHGEGWDKRQRERPSTITIHQLKARVTKLDTSTSEAEERQTGLTNVSDIEIVFNFADLAALGLISGNQAIFKLERDFFMWEDQQYKLMLVDYQDSDFAGEHLLCKVNSEKAVETYSEKVKEVITTLITQQDESVITQDGYKIQLIIAG